MNSVNDVIHFLQNSLELIHDSHVSQHRSIVMKHNICNGYCTKYNIFFVAASEGEKTIKRGKVQNLITGLIGVWQIINNL